MKVRKSIKCIILMFVMVVAFSVMGSTVEAATKTKKLTLLVGEKISYSYIGLGSIKSVKSSKSKIVSAKKKSGKSIMTAKKAGKAVVTVKGARGTFKYNITVKKADFSTSISQITEDYALISVTNNTSVYFNYVDLNCIFKDAAGNPLKTYTPSVSYLGPKQTAYYKIYLVDNAVVANTDLSVVDWTRSIDYTYKNYAKKVTMTDYISNGKLYVNAKTSYKGSGYIYAAFDVLFYDAAGKLVGASTTNYISLYKNRKTDTDETYIPDGAVSYQIVNKRVILKEYK